MAESTGSIMTWVSGAIPDMPGHVFAVNNGITNLEQWIRLKKITIQNWTGDSISNANVAEKYQNILFNLGKAAAKVAMAGEGGTVGFDVTYGEFKIENVGGADSNIVKDIEAYLGEANSELKEMLGKTTRFQQVF